MKLKWEWDGFDPAEIDMRHDGELMGWIGFSASRKTCYTMASWVSTEHPLDYKRFKSLRKAMRALRHAYIAHVISGGLNE